MYAFVRTDSKGSCMATRGVVRRRVEIIKWVCGLFWAFALAGGVAYAAFSVVASKWSGASESGECTPSPVWFGVWHKSESPPTPPRPPPPPPFSEYRAPTPPAQVKEPPAAAWAHKPPASMRAGRCAFGLAYCKPQLGLAAYITAVLSGPSSYVLTYLHKQAAAYCRRHMQISLLRLAMIQKVRSLARTGLVVAN